jgi:hypothetical protein
MSLPENPEPPLSDYRDTERRTCILAKNPKAVILGRHTQKRRFGDAAYTVDTAIREMYHNELEEAKKATSVADHRITAIIDGIGKDRKYRGVIINNTMEKFVIPGMQEEPPEDFVVCFELERVIRSLEKLHKAVEKLRELEKELEKDIAHSEEGMVGYMIFRTKMAGFEKARMGPKVDV